MVKQLLAGDAVSDVTANTVYPLCWEWTKVLILVVPGGKCSRGGEEGAEVEEKATVGEASQVVVYAKCLHLYIRKGKAQDYELNDSKYLPNSA